MNLLEASSQRHREGDVNMDVFVDEETRGSVIHNVEPFVYGLHPVVCPYIGKDAGLIHDRQFVYCS